MHKDEKEPKETLGEKVKDKAHEIKEDLKEDAEKMKEGVKTVSYTHLTLPTKA